MTSFEIQLEEILEKNPSTIVKTQKEFFKKLIAETGDRYILFGSGRLGQITLAGLQKVGIRPLAFADNNPKLWNTKINGLQVLSPESAADKFGANAIFVITVYTCTPVWKQLTDMGLNVTSFASLAWQYSQSLTPHGGVELPGKVFEQAGDVRKTLFLWEDETSRCEYIGQLLWQSSLDRTVLPPHLPQKDIYFADDLYNSLVDEVFLDCGAFDGDSIQEFLKRRDNSFGQIIAIEPDPENCKAFEIRMESLPMEIRSRIRVIQSALGSNHDVVMFNVTGTAGSSIGNGSYQVQCIPLDEMNDIKPTLIKMDIEGAEKNALKGAQKIIKRNMPVIAVCLYHAQEHLWQIPLLIQSISSDYKFFLRRYSDECWESVCYAIPKDRLRLNQL